jgi:hypothetical protein
MAEPVIIACAAITGPTDALLEEFTVQAPNSGYTSACLTGQPLVWGQAVAALGLA